MEAHTPQMLREALSGRRTTRAMSRVGSHASAPNADDFGLTKRKFARELDDAATEHAAPPAEPAAPAAPARKPSKQPKPPPPAAVLAAARSRAFFLELLALERRLPAGAMAERWRFARRRWVSRVERAADEAVFISAEAGEALLELESNVAPCSPRSGWALCRQAWQGEVSRAVELAAFASATAYVDQLSAALESAEGALGTLRYALAPSLGEADVAGGSAMEVEADEGGGAQPADERCWHAFVRRCAHAVGGGELRAAAPPTPARAPRAGAEGVAGSGEPQQPQGPPSLEASPASTEPATRSPDASDYREHRSAPARRPLCAREGVGGGLQRLRLGIPATHAPQAHADQPQPPARAPRGGTRLVTPPRPGVYGYACAGGAPSFLSLSLSPHAHHAGGPRTFAPGASELSALLCPEALSPPECDADDGHGQGEPMELN